MTSDELHKCEACAPPQALDTCVSPTMMNGVRGNKGTAIAHVHGKTD
jgi:hypothetical protein